MNSIIVRHTIYKKNGFAIIKKFSQLWSTSVQRFPLQYTCNKHYNYSKVPFDKFDQKRIQEKKTKRKR